MNLSDVLKNLKSKVFKNKEKLDLIRKIISTSINFEIKENEIKIIGDSVKLFIHPTLKHEVKIRKIEIIKNLNKNNIFISNII